MNAYDVDVIWRVMRALPRIARVFVNHARKAVDSA